MDVFRKIKVFFIFLLICYLPAHSQFQFTRLTPENGLSQSAIFCITQDKTGFMWFGTLDGLNKYDGYQVTVYRPNPLDSTSLADLGVKNLLSDRSGNLWIIMSGGKVDRYNPEADNFIHYLINPPDSSGNEAVGYISIAEDAFGKLWLAAANCGLYYFDPDADCFIHQPVQITNHHNSSALHFITLYADPKGTLWIGTREGLLFNFDTRTKRIEYRLEISVNGRPVPDTIQSIIGDDQGRLWIATEYSGIMIYDPEQQTFANIRHDRRNPDSPGSDKLYVLLKDRRSNIWIGSVDAGLDMYSPSENKYRHFRHNPNIASTLSNNAVMTLYEDKTGGIWVGTFYGGVNRLNERSRHFTNITYSAENPAGISEHPVLALCEDSAGALWIGTDGGGLFHQDRKSGRFTRYFESTEQSGSCTITALLCDKSGNCWIGNDNGDIMKYDRASDAFITIPRILGSNDAMLVIRQDKSGDLWIGTVFGGLYRYNPHSGTIRNYAMDEKRPGALSGNFIYSIYEDRRGALWIGTRKAGLNRFDPVTETFTCYRNDPADTASLSDNTVLCITDDEAGNLWLGTWGGGLNRFHPATGKFDHFTTENGLPGNIVYAVIPDNSGNLWISANRGLCRFNPERAISNRFDKSDGLLNFEFNPGASLKSGNGYFCFGGNKGLTIFHPDSIRDNPHIPALAFTGFSVFNKPFPLQKSVNALNKIVLNYRQNFFSIDFSALDYSAPHKNQYAYLLDGVDQQWVHASNHNYASYTGVAPGKYVFRLKGSNNDGLWNNEERRISIIITPPFWETWWFRFMAFSAITALLYALYAYRLHKLLEVERTRVRIARDLHDEVSATLTGIAYFSSAIKSETQNNQTPMLQKLLGLIQESVSEVQEAMSEIIWSVNPEYDQWQMLLPKFRRYASDLCESKGIQHEIQIPEIYPMKTLTMERRRDLWLILKEMLTNSIKHSQCSELKIKIEFINQEAHIRFSDNGCGFDGKLDADGNGLKNIRNRTALLKGNLQLETTPEQGTRWQIRIPIR
jgi:ligand-binding sensor domain-containing protein/signal transduction histidine kinase